MTINLKEVQWTLTAESTYIDPYEDLGECMRKSDITKLLNRAEYNIWQWCDVKLTGKYRGILKAHDYLGACSYKSEKDFQLHSGYYEDMQECVLEDLNTQLQTLTQ